MVSTELVVICVSAFISVFVLLAVLATVMRLIIVIFPQKAVAADAAVIAAVTVTARAVYPGTKVTNVEELK